MRVFAFLNEFGFQNRGTILGALAYRIVERFGPKMSVDEWEDCEINFPRLYRKYFRGILTAYELTILYRSKQGK